MKNKNKDWDCVIICAIWGVIAVFMLIQFLMYCEVIGNLFPYLFVAAFYFAIVILAVSLFAAVATIISSLTPDRQDKSEKKKEEQMARIKERVGDIDELVFSIGHEYLNEVPEEIYSSLYKFHWNGYKKVFYEYLYNHRHYLNGCEIAACFIQSVLKKPIVESYYGRTEKVSEIAIIFALEQRANIEIATRTAINFINHRIDDDEKALVLNSNEYESLIRKIFKEHYKKDKSEEEMIEWLYDALLTAKEI